MTQLCKICGREFKHHAGIYQHMKKHERDKEMIPNKVSLSNIPPVAELIHKAACLLIDERKDIESKLAVVHDLEARRTVIDAQLQLLLQVEQDYLKTNEAKA